QQYIAYKFCKISFVDIVVQEKGLKLYLKMNLNELQDEIKEKLKIRDVSNIGRPCVGNMEVELETKENIPYCLGLIKQALEKQMGGRNRQ
ncbi:RloF, partial [Helicobacter pylori]